MGKSKQEKSKLKFKECEDFEKISVIKDKLVQLEEMLLQGQGYQETLHEIRSLNSVLKELKDEIVTTKILPSLRDTLTNGSSEQTHQAVLELMTVLKNRD